MTIQPTPSFPPPPSSVQAWWLATMLTRRQTARLTTSVGRGGDSSPADSVLWELFTTNNTSSVTGGLMLTVLWLISSTVSMIRLERQQTELIITDNKDQEEEKDLDS